MARVKTLYFIGFHKPLFCLLLLVGYSQIVAAQSIQANSQNYISIGDTSQLTNGATFPVTFKVSCYGGSAALSNWKLTVQPQTAYLIPAQTSSEVAQFGTAPNWPIKYFSTQYNSGSSSSSWSNGNSANLIGAVSSAVPLSGSELTLVQQSGYAIVPSDYFTMAYDFVLVGNRQMLLLHRDNYSVVLRFRLYNQSNTLLSQYDLTVQMGIWPQYGSIPQNVPQYSNLIQLQNGASNVALSFSTNNAYTNGVDASFADGLKVSSTDGRYEVKVQTTSDYFTKSGALTTIPTNAIQITPSQGSTAVTTTTYTPVKMNSTQQTIITNHGNQGTVNNYTVKFGTTQNANQSAFTGVASGVYTTQVTFIMNPL